MINVGDPFPSLMSIIHINVWISTLVCQSIYTYNIWFCLKPCDPGWVHDNIPLSRQEDKGTVSKIFKYLWCVCYETGTTVSARGDDNDDKKKQMQSYPLMFIV